MAIFLLLVFNTLADELKYNEPVQSSVESLLEFYPISSGYSTVTVSSNKPVLIYFRKDKAPTSNEYDQVSLNSLILSKLDSASKYYLSVHPSDSFTLLLENSEYRKITDSQPVHEFIQEASQHLFIFNNTSQSDLKISLVFFSGKAQLLVSDQDPTSNNTVQNENWEFGRVARVKAKDFLKISVIGLTNTFYSLVIDSGKDLFLNESEISGLVEEHSFENYVFQVDQNQTLRIKLSIFSGDCFFYVKVNSRPTAQDYHWAFTDHGSQIIDLSPKDQQQHPGSLYYLSVYGRKSSAFVLNIQNSEKPVHRLVSGFPSLGRVENSEFEYFSFDIKKNREVSILLTARSGNPDLYAKFCVSSSEKCFFMLNDTKNPSSSIYFSNNTFGLEEINLKETGELFIGVFGASQSTSEFTIVAVVNDQDVLLQSGIPQTATIPEEGFRYYKYKLSKWSASSVQFMLTPISGNPDLYVSRTTRPSLKDFDSSSSKNGLEVDSVTYAKGKDYESLNGTYYISVYSQGPSQFSIVVKENHPNGNTTIQLYPGIPQKDTFYSHCMKHRLYFFPVKFTEETKKPIQITITAITGKFFFAAANKIEMIDHENHRFWYYWSTLSTGQDTANTILISPSDPYYLVKSNYAVLVSTTEFAGDNTATYSIFLKIGDDIVILSDNSPIVDIVKEKSFSYYTFPITTTEEDLVIKLTSFSGSPVILASFNNTKPDENDNDYTSKRKRSDEMILTWQQLKSKCPKLPEKYHHGDATYCSLYIAVTSSSESRYAISVHANIKNKQLVIIPSTLLSILSHEPRYYYGFPNSTQDIVVDCQASIGEVKFYLKVMTKYHGEVSDIIFPSKEDFDFQSDAYLIHSQKKKIKHSDLKNKCQNECIFALTVECGSDPCEYTLSITQDDVVSLVEGESYLASVGGDGYSFFSYFCAKDNQDFIIVVVPMDSGDPDLYVKKSISSLPSKTQYDWKSQTWAGETLIIQKDDALFLEGNATIRGNYLIAVYGKTKSSFSIRVSQDPKPVKKLLSGIPDKEMLNENDYAYFYYQSSVYSDIIIQVTPFYGKAVIYAKTQKLYEDDIYSNLPTSSDYIFSSLTDISQFNLIISKDSPDFCVSCNLIIAVKCTVDCWFSIQVSHKLKLSLLQNGVPTRGEASQKTWTFYYFEVTSNSDVDFSLSVFSGDPDLFINTEIDLSFTNSKWSSLTIDNYEQITISKDDENFIIGGYYLGVYAHLTSSFALTAHIKSSFVKLISGLPLSYSISPSSYMYFQFTQKSVLAQNIHCNLVPSDSQKPEVFIKLEKEPTFPGPENYKFKYAPGDYKDLYQGLNIRLKMDPEETLYISVKAGVEIFSNFSLSCSGKDDVKVLKPNKEIYDFLYQNKTKQVYEINIEQKGILSVFLIPCVGEQTLAISSSWTMENKYRPDVVVNTLNDGRLVAVINNANGRYYIEVTGKNHIKDDVSYVLSTYFSDLDHSEIIVPGNYGKIDMGVRDDGVLLEWISPVYENLTRFNGEVSYVVYLLDSLEHFSACSIMLSEELGKSAILKTTQEAKYLFTGKQKSYINLIAVLPMNVKSFRFLPYDAVLVTPVEEKSSVFIFIWILAAVIICVLIYLGYIFFRTKKIERNISIEMTIGRDFNTKGFDRMKSGS